MKTSIIIAICLALRSLANVIPPSIRGPARGAIFRRQNFTRAMLGSSDESDIGQAGIGSAFARRESIDPRALSFSPFKSRDVEKKNDEDKDRRDIHHLNHALFLKRFLCSFFERGLSRYSQEDFVRAGYPDWVRGRYTQILDVAKVHRDFLESAITSAGSERVRPCNFFEFGDNDVRAFIDQSAALGTISASAFTGSMHNFNNRAYTTAGASMLAVEARHAAWINSAVRKENPSNCAFETPLTPNHVATLLSKFVNFDSCPAENRDLLPEGYHPHPRLFLSPRLVPGEEAEISFPHTELGQGERFYAAFMAGAETIFARVIEREKDNGSGPRFDGSNRNGNGQFPGGWPSSDNRDGNRNKHAGDDHRDGHNNNNNHDEDHNHDDGRQNENDHHSDNNRGDKEKDEGNRKDENDDNRKDDNHKNHKRRDENDRNRKDENDRNREDGNDRNRKDGNDHNRMDGNDDNRMDNDHNRMSNDHNRMDGHNPNRKDGNDHNRMDENDHNRIDEKNRNRKDSNDHRMDGNNHSRKDRNDHNDGKNHNGMNHGSNFIGNRPSNFASSGFNAHDNNNRRFFVEIPRDLATKGSVFVVVVKGRDNIGEVRLDEQSTVAGPAIANFPFDAWNKPIGH